MFNSPSPLKQGIGYINLASLSIQVYIVLNPEQTGKSEMNLIDQKSRQHSIIGIGDNKPSFVDMLS